MNLDGMEAIDYIEENNIQGCIVECGVHEGYKEKEFIIRLNQLNSQPRHIFMYDTFKGMVPPTEHDFTLTIQYYIIALVKKHFYVGKTTKNKIITLGAIVR